jgi:hypothetical protein
MRLPAGKTWISRSREFKFMPDRLFADRLDDSGVARALK